MSIRRALTATLLMLAAGSALAHTGGHGSATFSSGFAHPVGGLDHLLAMIAVGLFAARQSGALRWMLPATFVLAMLGGALLGAAGVALPFVESGIAASVLVFGLLIALVARLPMAAALSLVGGFALFHGFAHHGEMGEGSLAAFAGGFMMATVLLHAAGYALARWMPETAPARTLHRIVGGAIAGAGAVLLGA